MFRNLAFDKAEIQKPVDKPSPRGSGCSNAVDQADLDPSNVEVVGSVKPLF